MQSSPTISLPCVIAPLNPLLSVFFYIPTLLVMVHTMSGVCRKLFLTNLLTSTVAANLALPTSWRVKHGSLTTPLTEPPSTESLFPRSQQLTDYDTCGYRDGKSGELKFEDLSTALTDIDQPVVCPGYYFCNTQNAYNLVACCADAAITSGYHPYACQFYYTCFDSTQSISLSNVIDTTMPATKEGGDKIKAMYW